MREAYGKKKIICRFTVFFILFGILFVLVSRLLSFKYEDGIKQMERFYRLDKGSVDVLVLGSSHAYVDIDPAILYEEQGIAAYDLCASMQPMWNTYYYLKEALKYQKPKLIVLDVYRIVENFTYEKESKIIKSTFGMRLSKNKWESVLASMQEEDKKEAVLYMLEFPFYHSRYGEVTLDDLRYYLCQDKGYKGYDAAEITEEQQRPDISQVTETYLIEAKTEEYFRKILALAGQEDIPVFLISTPYVISEDDQMVYNAMEELLQEEYADAPVTYRNFNLEYDEIGLDFSTDFADYDHLNVKGVAKFDTYLGACLKENYDLPDRRGVEGFESYEACAASE